jgi:hypothetical protein
MNRTVKIAELKHEMARWEQIAAEAVAKVRGMEVEIAALETGVRGRGDLAGIPQQTDAILAVLRSAPGTLTPSEVTALLNDAGRGENLKTVTSLLSYLLKEGQVQRPSRGRYLAV